MSNRLISKLIESSFLKDVYARLKLGPIFILILFFLTCKKSYGPCETDPNTYYYLDVSDKAKIPYKGDELLMFTNNYGDTAICIGEGVKQFFVTQSGFSYSCDRDYFMHYEGLKYVYKDLNNKLNFEINGYFKDEFDQTNRVNFIINGLQFSEYSTGFSGLVSSREIIPISTTKKIYLGIPAINLDRRTDTIYFNLQRGIIGIKTDTIHWRLYEYE
jgi:hypothetical protein